MTATAEQLPAARVHALQIKTHRDDIFVELLVSDGPTDDSKQEAAD